MQIQLFQPTQKIMIPNLRYLIWETNRELFLAATVKNDSNMQMSFFKKTLLLLVHTWTWNDLIQDSFLLCKLESVSLFFILIRICIHKHQIFSGLLIKIVLSIFIKKFSSSFVNTCWKPLTTQTLLQKQPFADFLQNRCS